MFVTLTTYYLAAQAINVQALPQAPLNNCKDIDECRTLGNIIWSCLATVFACTWIAIHLNIPGPDDGWIKIALRKLGVMVLAVIAPELVVAWAMRQWLVARRIAKDHKRSKTHGFFALMGGFVRYDCGDGPYTLSPIDLKPHLRKGDITEKAIQDKSKGDVLSKGFAILQTGWFVLQCIARQYQHLPVTELEIITLAFAILNFVTYALWWNKPLDVRDPFVVRDELGEKEEHGEVEEEVTSKSVWDAIRHKVLCAINSVITITCQVPGAIAKAVHNTVGYIRRSESWSVNNVIDIVLYPVLILFDMASGGDGPESKQVPMFHSGKLTDGETNYAFFMGILLATIFGAIHCIAWSFDFPTPAEQLLWRISSLSITCVPILLFMLRFVYNWLETVLIRIPVTLLSIVYIVSRVILLVLAFMSLRSLPSDTYRTVHWTTFIPHI